MSDCINERKGCDTHGLHYHSPRLEITYSENEVTEKFAALRAEVAALLERIALDNAVCLCGCAAKDHEDLGEDGEQCEHEDHECLRVAPAVLAAMQAERASNAALREALDAIDARLARRTTLDGLTRLQKIELALRVCEETDPKGEVAAKYVVRALARAAEASPSASDGGGGER